MDTFLEYRIHRSLLRVLISLWREREREREREGEREFNFSQWRGFDWGIRFGSRSNFMRRIFRDFFLFFSSTNGNTKTRRSMKFYLRFHFAIRFLFRGKRNGLKNPLRRKESIEFSMLDANRRSRDPSFTKTKNKTAKESFSNDYCSKKYN